MTVSKYRIEFNKEVLDLGEQGKSPAQIRAHFISKYKISSKTFSTWLKTNDEFGEAFESAQDLAQAYHEDIGAKGVKGLLPKFNGPAWVKTMQSRFKKDYGNDPQVIKIDHVKQMTDEELEAAIAALQKKPQDPSSGAPANPG